MATSTPGAASESQQQPCTANPENLIDPGRVFGKQTTTPRYDSATDPQSRTRRGQAPARARPKAKRPRTQPQVRANETWRHRLWRTSSCKPEFVMNNSSKSSFEDLAPAASTSSSYHLINSDAGSVRVHIASAVFSQRTGNSA